MPLLQQVSQPIRSSLRRDSRREEDNTHGKTWLTGHILYSKGDYLVYPTAATRRRKRANMAQIEYTRHGDYLLPNIIINEPPRELTEPITRYGSMRRKFLKEHRSITYNRLLLSERLFPHLREIQQKAHERLDRIMSDILIFQPPPDKVADGIAWATHMTAVRRTAEVLVC